MKFVPCLSTLPWITGSLSSLIRTAKAFFPISYYRLPWQTVQSIIVDYTAYCSGRYSPLPETVVVNRKKGLNIVKKRG